MASDELEYQQTTLYAEDIRAFASPNWMTDSCISFAMDWMANDLALESHSDVTASERACFVHPGTGMLARFEEDPDDLRDLFSDLDLQSPPLVLFFINNSDDLQQVGGGSHWSLLAYHRPAPAVGAEAEAGAAGAAAGGGGGGPIAWSQDPSGEFKHYDSALGMNLTPARQLARKVWPLLQPAGADEALPAVRSVRISRQRNGHDCGAYALMAAELLLQGKSDDFLKSVLKPAAVEERRRQWVATVQALLAGSRRE